MQLHQPFVGNNKKQSKIAGINRPEGSNIKMAVPMAYAIAVRLGLPNEVITIPQAGSDLNVHEVETA